MTRSPESEGLRSRRDFLAYMGRLGMSAGLAAAMWESFGRAAPAAGQVATSQPTSATAAQVAAASQPTTHASGMEYIKVAGDNWGFIGRESGKPFVPFGCNYYDPTTGWVPRIWAKFDADRVRHHFDLMAGIGVNVVRVFLSTGVFMPREGQLSVAAIDKLDTMIAIGAERGIRFDLSALNSWEGWASWGRGDFWADERVLDAQGAYLEALFRHYRGEGAIFCVDLSNEPHVGWGSREMRAEWPLWLKRELPSRPAADQPALEAYLKAGGDELAIPPSKAAENDAVLYTYQCFREWLGTRWAKRNAEAAKRADPNRLVSIGLVQWSFPLGNSPGSYAAVDPQQVGPALDFTSAHFYPILTEGKRLFDQFALMQQYCKAWVRYAWCGKPVVVEEFGWGGGGPKDRRDYYSEDEQVAWNAGLIDLTKDSASGWLVWPFADNIDSRDVSKWAGLFTMDGQKKAWGAAFEGLAKKFKATPLVRARGKVLRVDMRRALTTMGEKIPMYETHYAQQLLAQLTPDGPWDLVQQR